MRILGFKEWLSKTASDGAGAIWSNTSNADLSYGKYLKSKYTQTNHNKSGPAEIDPEKMYLGISQKQNKENLGDNNGISNTSPNN